MSEEERKTALYFTGHRPVLGRYALRQEERLVQIHNPDFEQVVLFVPGKKFDPEKHIFDVEKR